jgi:hypothetical protein
MDPYHSITADEEELHWEAFINELTSFRPSDPFDSLWLIVGTPPSRRSTASELKLDVYNITGSNIFLQMQMADPIHNELQHERDLLASDSLSKQLKEDFHQAAKEAETYKSDVSIAPGMPRPDDFAVDSQDLHYFSWFVKEGPALFGLQILFPTALGLLYGVSANHSVLYHAILSISTYFVDMGLKRPSNIDRHLNLVVPQVQNAITEGVFNDGHIYAVFLLGAMFTFRANLDIGARYLHGMTLMIQRSEQIRLERGEDTTRSPLIDLILRTAISLFNRVSIVHQRILAIDPLVLRSGLEQPWVETLARKGFADFARATYITNDCMFAILRLTHHAMNIRGSNRYNPEIHEVEINQEINEIYQIIEHFQNTLALRARGPTIPLNVPTGAPQGLFTPVKGITVQSYGYRLIGTYLLMIALTLVQNPRIGPVSEERCRAAAELCRHYAAVEHQRCDCPNFPILTALWSAGLTFGPKTHPIGNCVHLCSDIRIRMD